MTKSKKKRMMKYRQKLLNRTFAYLILMNVLIVLMIVLTVFVRTSQNNKIDDGRYILVYESIDHNTEIPSATVLLNK